MAALALHKLGLQQSASSFLRSYTVSSATARVLTITASGPSADQAQLRASAVANAFLTFRANELRCAAEPRGGVAQPADQPGQAACQLDRRADQPAIEPARFIRAAVAAQQAPSGTNHCGERAVQPSASRRGNQSTTLPALTAALKNSQVLSVTPIPHSKKKILVTYVAIGLIAGLVRGPGHRHRPSPGIRSATPTGRRRVCARRSRQAQCPDVARPPPASALAWPGRQAEP